MQLNRRLFALGATATAAEGSARAQTPDDTLNGVWQGSLTPVRGRGLRRAQGQWQPFRISISGDRARVFLQKEDSDSFEEIKPGAFRASRVARSAVIQAIDYDPGGEAGDGWVESWSFSVTMKGPDAIACAFTRQVNNHHMQPTEEMAIFTMFLTGDLQRIANDHV